MARPITLEWLKAARDDIEVMKTILKRADLTHMVAFHAQQAIEKSLKALLEEKGEAVPKIHSLQALASRLALDIDTDLLADLDMLYIDSRYPGSFGLLPEGKPSLQKAAEFYEAAIKIYTNIYEEVTS